MAALGEGQGHRSGVGDLVYLLERGVVDNAVGHLEHEVERELLARFGRGHQAIRNRLVRFGHDLVTVVARQAMAAHVRRAFGRGRLAVAQRADYGKQNRGALCPPARVALPQVLTAVEVEAHELRALCVNLRRKRSASDLGNRRICHATSFPSHRASRVQAYCGILHRAQRHPTRRTAPRRLRMETPLRKRPAKRDSPRHASCSPSDSLRRSARTHFQNVERHTPHARAARAELTSPRSNCARSSG